LCLNLCKFLKKSLYNFSAKFEILELICSAAGRYDADVHAATSRPMEARPRNLYVLFIDLFYETFTIEVESAV